MTAQTQVILKYGLPDKDYQAKWCEMWNISEDFPWTLEVMVGASKNPWKRVFINKDFKAKVKIAFTNLQTAGLHTEIKTFDGCYVDRKVRGANTRSLHAWAIAFDMNASVESLGQVKTNWSPRFIAIMKAAGLYWGGDWKGRKDNMHFALYNG